MNNPNCVYPIDENDLIPNFFENFSLENFEIPVFFKKITVSTNLDVRQIFEQGVSGPFIVIAERQLNAYGQRGHRWVGDVLGNFYASVGIEISENFRRKIPFLGQYIAMEVCASLNNCYDVDLKTKWPNDIFSKNKKKIGGILVEVLGKNTGALKVIVGLGINVLRVPRFPNAAYEADSLANVSKKAVDFSAVAKVIIHCLARSAKKFFHVSKEEIIEEWKFFDCFFDKQICVVSQQMSLIGKECGLGNGGELRVQTVSGEIVEFRNSDAKIAI